MDIFFEGTPVEKWKEIIFNASPTLVGLDLERLLQRLAVCEMLLEAHNVDIDDVMDEFVLENSMQVEERKGNIAIESMGKILGNYE